MNFLIFPKKCIFSKSQRSTMDRSTMTRELGKPTLPRASGRVLIGPAHEGWRVSAGFIYWCRGRQRGGLALARQLVHKALFDVGRPTNTRASQLARLARETLQLIGWLPHIKRLTGWLLTIDHRKKSWIWFFFPVNLKMFRFFFKQWVWKLFINLESARTKCPQHRGVHPSNLR